MDIEEEKNNKSKRMKSTSKRKNNNKREGQMNEQQKYQDLVGIQYLKVPSIIIQLIQRILKNPKKYNEQIHKQCQLLESFIRQLSSVSFYKYNVYVDASNKREDKFYFSHECIYCSKKFPDGFQLYIHLNFFHPQLDYLMHMDKVRGKFELSIIVSNLKNENEREFDEKIYRVSQGKQQNQKSRKKEDSNQMQMQQQQATLIQEKAQDNQLSLNKREEQNNYSIFYKDWQKLLYFIENIKLMFQVKYLNELVFDVEKNISLKDIKLIQENLRKQQRKVKSRKFNTLPLPDLASLSNGDNQEEEIIRMQKENQFKNQYSNNYIKEQFKDKVCYHSHNIYEKITPDNLLENSDDEIDDRLILEEEENRDLEEFEDVNQTDKNFFKIWNKYARNELHKLKKQHQPVLKSEFFSFLEKFMDQNLETLKKYHVNFSAHLITLQNCGLIQSKDIVILLKRLTQAQGFQCE